MAHTNRGRVILGGLVAGLIINVVEYYPLGLFPTRLLVITSIVSLVEMMVATLVGAWLYKEEGAMQAQRVAA